MARKLPGNAELVSALYQKYLSEACEAKVSVRVGRSWQIAAYKCFPEMAEAMTWAEAQSKKLQKKHKAVKLVVTNRSRRQWRLASLNGSTRRTI
jgi:hypothetical protein